MLGDADRPIAVLPPDGTSDRVELPGGVLVRLELDPVHLRVVVDHADPSIDGDDRNDPAALRREGVKLLRQWVQAVFIRDHDKSQKLAVRSALKDGIFQGLVKFRGIAVEAGAHQGKGGCP